MAKTDPITENQLKFIANLVDKRDWAGLEAAQIEFLSNSEWWPTMNIGQASSCIKALLECPQVITHPPVQSLKTGPGGTASFLDEGEHENHVVILSSPESASDANIPRKGYYFIVDTTADSKEWPDGRESFFRIQHGKEWTRWEDYVFLSIQASDDFYPIRDEKRRLKIFELIMGTDQGISAMNEYGVRLGVCGNCHRTLTDKHSRLQGMGPVCAERILGQATPEENDLLKQLGLI